MSRFNQMLKNHRAPVLTENEYMEELADSLVRQINGQDCVVTVPFASFVWAYALWLRGWREVRHFDEEGRGLKNRKESSCRVGKNERSV